MDLRIVLTVSALLLTSAETDPITLKPETDTPFIEQTISTCSNCSSSNEAPTTTTPTPGPTPSHSASAVGLLMARWTSKCEGDVNLILSHPNKSSLPVCYGSETNIQSFLKKMCENQDGCKDTPHCRKGQVKPNGFYITESGAEARPSCETLRIQCKVKVLQDVQGQLQAYKVVTALLCCMLLVLLLIRFTRPTIKALQKRFSERRQNRWVGPTQSHSVSYHRGKSAVKNNEGEKRLSYPALERLAVIDSREPSSNRNSDCMF